MMSAGTWPFWHLTLSLALGLPTKGLRFVHGQWDDA